MRPVEPTAAQLDAIAARLLPQGKVESVRRLTGGVSADVHALALAGAGGERRTVVLRRHRAAEWKPREPHVAAMEHRLLERLFPSSVPVPEPLLLDLSGEVLTDPYLVMAFAEGTSDIPDAALGASLEVMAHTLARLHALPCEGLPPLPPRTDPLPEVYDYLTEPVWDDLRAHLTTWNDSACTGPPSILHGDFWTGNLLWQNARLVAVIDWEDAALGDPVSDVAVSRLELTWRYGPDAALQFTRLYADSAPLDYRRLRLWDVYVAAAASHFMAQWGLEPDREAAMRDGARTFILAAGEALVSGAY